jgi:hypothetical protein
MTNSKQYSREYNALLRGTEIKREYSRRYRARHKDRIIAYQRAYEQSERGKAVRSGINRRYYLKHKRSLDNGQAH